MFLNPQNEHTVIYPDIHLPFFPGMMQSGQSF